MGLILLYPHIANRSCHHCQEFEYVDGERNRGEPDYGKCKLFNGKPQRRHHKNPPLCRTPEGCPKGTPEKPNTLTPRNRKAYLHYLECRAVSSFPDDPIVRRNARLIRSVEDDVAEVRRIEEIVSRMTPQ